MRLLIGFRFAGCAILLPLLCTACSRTSEERKQKYFQSGQRYFETGKYGEARIEFMAGGVRATITADATALAAGSPALRYAV